MRGAILCFLVLVGASLSSASDIYVTVEQGMLLGSTDGSVDRFLGVPFAAAPVGNLRWKPPQPAPSFENVYNATQYKPMCMQTSAQGIPSFTSEDCLYLNIWGPAQKSASEPLPVMLFIHGGAFLVGTGILYDGSAMAQLGNVVVVSTNYRLGSFGFFASQALLRESKTTGNYGIQDQRAALLWIKKNIAQFGGDPNKVTIFGESAGATSVCQHMVAKDSQDLFHRAIMQSGICHALELQEVTNEISIPFIQRLNCSIHAASDVALLECLRSIPAEQVLITQETLERPGPAIYLPWFPVIDGAELTIHPLKSLYQGLFSKVPFLIGVTRDEYSSFMCPYMNLTSTETQVEDFLARTFGNDTLPRILNLYNWKDYAYPVQLAIDASSDAVFKCPTHIIADAIFSSGSFPVYLYQFEHDPGFNRFNRECFRVSHAYELPFLFPAALLWMGGGYQFTPEESNLVKAMILSWTQFARTGDPNYPGAVWNRYITDEAEYTILDLKISIGQDFRGPQCRMWPK